ncbi:iron chelate uptake ABC transporter family permease subunit, partial [Streptomyces sp. NPDC059999]|uniref:iron chelate uptake ABC transporter family permease subunit n=1 Tax=Streptomyces sp. NPDC059999 TaxID=3347030 RepID=UPI0036C5A625
MWTERIPRTLLGPAVGASLGASGLVMQALTMNPLSDPGILGVEQGAAMFVVLGILFLDVNDASGFFWLALVGSAIAAGVEQDLDGLQRRDVACAVADTRDHHRRQKQAGEQGHHRAAGEAGSRGRRQRHCHPIVGPNRSHSGVRIRPPPHDERGAPHELYEEGGFDGQGHGLIGMRERIGMVGG